MHTALSSRIAKLSSNLSTPSSPKQLKSDIFDLAKDCQVLAEQSFLLRVTARGMTQAVKCVFGPMAIIFPLTEPGRRHIYLAVFAKLDVDHRLDHVEAAGAFITVSSNVAARSSGINSAPASGDHRTFRFRRCHQS